jgi:phosphoesterase RecJ-like protein
MSVTVTAQPLSWESESVREALAAAVSLIRGSRSALVVSHEGPDGDAIGATLATALALEAAGLSVTRFNVDAPPPNLQFLAGADSLVRSLPDASSFDLTVVVDCSERHRVGRSFPTEGWGARTLCLDHHVTFDPGIADVLVHDDAAPATVELVYRLIVTLGVPLTPEIATCLWVGLLTDTGSFRYQCTTAEAMELGQRILETRINTWEVSSHVYESQAIARIRLLGRVLDTLWLSDSGRVAVLTLEDTLLDEFGGDASLADGFINHARGIDGVEVAVMMSGSDARGYKLSFRSRGRVDVARLAKSLGGGGHRHAAGCFMELPARDVLVQIESALGTVA